jgi:SSS family solute:Na+ symporter
MHLLDWLIVAAFLSFMTMIAVIVARYTRTATQFLAAGRLAGRYLLTTAEGAAGIGAITIVGLFQQYYTAGLASMWWGQMLAPVALFLAISGWVIYRFRETRALTLAEFFERRYSRRFRIFTGVLAWISGVINYGVFPGVTARFFIHFCGLPETIQLGSLHLPLLPFVMLTCLLPPIVFTLTGGQTTVMITDFLQGIFMNLGFVIILLTLFSKFSWGTIVHTLEKAPPGESLLNPFDQGSIPAFTFSYFAIQIFLNCYQRMAWQGTQGYNCAARSPHEAKMAGILAQWRLGVTGIMLVLIPMIVHVALSDPQYASIAASAQEKLSHIHDPAAIKQMTVPTTLSYIFPIGVTGMFCAMMFAAGIATDNAYLHSWGSIFIQDVVLPFRKNELSAQQHIRMLRWSILGVAVWAFFFSWFFPLHDYIFMFFNITAAIYLGGIGAAIIGGLYWSRGTTRGAWCGMIVGSAFAVIGVILPVVWDKSQWLMSLRPTFPLDGMQMSFFAAIAGSSTYIIVSLLDGLIGGAQPVNMNRMLHRDETADATARPVTGWRTLGWNREFTRGDKLIYLLSLGWTVVMFTIFVVGTIWALTRGLPNSFWPFWWRLQVILWTMIGFSTTVWFLVGGLRDLRYLWRKMTSSQPEEEKVLVNS